MHFNGFDLLLVILLMAAVGYILVKRNPKNVDGIIHVYERSTDAKRVFSLDINEDPMDLVDGQKVVLVVKSMLPGSSAK